MPRRGNTHEVQLTPYERLEGAKCGAQAARGKHLAARGARAMMTSRAAAKGEGVFINRPLPIGVPSLNLFYRDRTIELYQYYILFLQPTKVQYHHVP